MVDCSTESFSLLPPQSYRNGADKNEEGTLRASSVYLVLQWGLACQMLQICLSMLGLNCCYEISDRLSQKFTEESRIAIIFST